MNVIENIQLCDVHAHSGNMYIIKPFRGASVSYAHREELRRSMSVIPIVTIDVLLVALKMKLELKS